MKRCAILLVLCLLAPALAADRATCPFVGHNTYGVRDGHDRLAAALASGIPGIELDVSWGKLRHRAVVTHSELTTGLGQPELGDVLARVWPAFGDGDRALFIDLKSGGDGMAQRIHALLAAHADQLSRMQPGGAFRPGRVTVYLSGDGGAQAAYEKVARAAGEYLAFGAVSREKDDWRADAAAYAPGEAPGWRRYVNMDIRCFMNSKQTGDVDLAALSPARLAAAAAACGQAGFPIRVWIVNAKRGGKVDTGPWKACIDAGIALIATDDYDVAMDFWKTLR